ncbi:hypothetical protein BDA99DRAFT_579968 [Phascolomyces articulosus]|uniref:Uncharacterized protein n=1 Tax=Phascolomyces articulosus TaxID=60185 RepID=A0AAD5K233_9FUNG|nr:hypothetical protein BDA99DRAFT_579968 [Phascolomyces articulosus]
MRVKKRRYWPRGMPPNDIVDGLDGVPGSVAVMKSREYSTFVAALPSGNVGKRWINDQLIPFNRLLVFEEYELHKGAVDTANNRRDNISFFHDVMKTYRWEIRCLSFFVAVAEANAFSAYIALRMIVQNFFILTSVGILENPF